MNFQNQLLLQSERGTTSECSWRRTVARTTVWPVTRPRVIHSEFWGHGYRINYSRVLASMEARNLHRTLLILSKPASDVTLNIIGCTRSHPPLAPVECTIKSSLRKSYTIHLPPGSPKNHWMHLHRTTKSGNLGSTTGSTSQPSRQGRVSRKAVARQAT